MGYMSVKDENFPRAWSFFYGVSWASEQPNMDTNYKKNRQNHVAHLAAQIKAVPTMATRIDRHRPFGLAGVTR